VETIVKVYRSGGPEKILFEEVEPVEPGPSEVRFKVHAFALNRADLQYIRGRHYTKLKLPSRIGFEASGIVEAVGSEVTGFRVGDRVSSIPFYSLEPDRHGVHGEFAIVPSDYLGPWPKEYAATEACSIWMQYLTAYFALAEVGGAGPGKTCLIAAAASSAGVGAVQVAKTLGAQVIATTRQETKRSFLERTGADHVMITGSGEGCVPILRGFTAGEGVDIVFDPIGGGFINTYVEALAWGARVLIYGNLSESKEFAVPILPLIRANASVHPYSMFNHVMVPRQLAAGIDFVMTGIRERHLRPAIDRVFEFRDIKSAYEHMLGNSQCGKIVVAVAADAR